jgi:hypothetical protein
MATSNHDLDWLEDDSELEGDRVCSNPSPYSSNQERIVECRLTTQHCIDCKEPQLPVLFCGVMALAQSLHIEKLF